MDVSREASISLKKLCPVWQMSTRRDRKKPQNTEVFGAFFGGASRLRARSRFGSEAPPGLHSPPNRPSSNRTLCARLNVGAAQQKISTRFGVLIFWRRFSPRLGHGSALKPHCGLIHPRTGPHRIALLVVKHNILLYYVHLHTIYRLFDSISP